MPPPFPGVRTPPTHMKLNRKEWERGCGSSTTYACALINRHIKGGEGAKPPPFPGVRTPPTHMKLNRKEWEGAAAPSVYLVSKCFAPK